jgi:tripartite-type tricarboxylate transporter receptor subunit TctC
MGHNQVHNTPAGIVDKLNREIDAGLADPKMQASFTDMGGIVLGGSPKDFGTMLAAEVDKWGKVVKFAGIKPGESGTPG